MQTQVDSRSFADHVVRLDCPGPLGTGFFVAPGWVLTAAHVAARAPAGVLTLRWRGLSLSAHVVELWPPGKAATVLWPYPDLALVRLDEAEAGLEHPVVRLALVDPESDETCHAWGYPPKVEGEEPTGRPATFTFEGTDGDGFFQLKAGEAPPGLSGAPLLSPSARGVVGVMTTTRRQGTALGGWASPVAALAALGDLAGRVLETNDAHHLRNRSWHFVLPAKGCAGVLDQPWGQFRKNPRSRPSDLLKADFAVVPFLFRDQAMVDLEQWCASVEPLALWQVSATGGAGKTRFAIEACRQLAKDGWVAGFRRHSADDASLLRLAARDEKLVDCPAPRFVVVDYAENTDVASLRELLGGLRSRCARHSAARVLLLVRDERKGMESLLDLLGETAALKAVTDAGLTAEVAVRLDHGERAALYRAALSAFAESWGVALPEDLREPSLIKDSFARPLDVLFEALDQVLSAEAGVAPGGGSPDQRVLDHEAHYWVAVPQMPGEAAASRGRQAQCVALATLAGAEHTEDALRLLACAPRLAGATPAQLEAHVEWLSGLYRGRQVLNPLEPDRLGEVLVAGVLAEQADGGGAMLGCVLGLAADAQVTRCLETMARVIVDHVGPRDPMAAAVGGRLQELVTRAEEQSRGSVEIPGRTTLAAALDRLLLAGLSEHIEALARAEPANTGYQRDVSVSYNKLADLARARGEGGQAEELYRKSLATREALARAEPANTGYQRDVSVSYDRLADLAVDRGEGGQAEELYRKSLAIAEALARAEPANTGYQRDVSVSYDRLADLAVDRGEGGQAEELYRKSLATREALARAEPANTGYQRDVSVSYDRLADLAVDRGEGGQAEELYRKSLAIAEALARAEPANTGYQRDVSVSYNKLADLARDRGEGGQAEELYRKSLAIAEALARAEPANTGYQRDVSVSYNRLADLARDRGEGGQAEELYRKSLATREALARAEPANTGYQRDVSVSYNRLADLARARGEGGQAEELYRKSLAIAEALARAEPANTGYQRDVSVSYDRLADLARARGEGGQAEELYRKSLAIAEALARAEPANTGYQRDVSISYNRLADLAVARGEAAQAEELYRKAASRRRAVFAREPERVDLAEELAVALALSTRVLPDSAFPAEAVALLTPFETAGKLTDKGRAVLRWAREITGS